MESGCDLHLYYRRNKKNNNGKSQSKTQKYERRYDGDV